jgi:hypothetical protein
VPESILKGLRAHGGKLELHDIADFIVDLKTAIVLADPDTSDIIYNPAWRNGLDARGVRMNTRIATAINGALDGTAKNVKYFKSLMRKANETDRPGILYSGLDMLEEIEALVTDRTIGEIKLNKGTIQDLKFEAGVDLSDSRLRANEIEQHFALKTAAERAVPNALLHEFISKIPDVGDEKLTLIKEDYERKLYTSEVNHEPPPWTQMALVNDIGVALARATVTRQIASIDKQPGPGAFAFARCHNCGEANKHANRDCPIVCTDGRCGFNFCPGARGMVCAVKFETPPSKRNPPLESALGRPLLSHLLDRLDAAWEAKHKKSAKAQPMQVDHPQSGVYDSD